MNIFSSSNTELLGYRKPRMIFSANVTVNSTHAQTELPHRGIAYVRENEEIFSLQGTTFVLQILLYDVGKSSHPFFYLVSTVLDVIVLFIPHFLPMNSGGPENITALSFHHIFDYKYILFKFLLWFECFCFMSSKIPILFSHV